MKRIIKIVFLLFTIVCFDSFNAKASSGNSNSSFNWEPVMAAIIQVESNGNVNARSGNSVGAMQITPVLVADCNQILKSRKQKKRYKLSDRFNLTKSKEMFLLIQSRYNPLNNIEKAIRLWNGGANYSVRHTQRYYEKVTKAMNK